MEKDLVEEINSGENFEFGRRIVREDLSSTSEPIDYSLVPKDFASTSIPVDYSLIPYWMNSQTVPENI